MSEKLEIYESLLNEHAALEKECSYIYMDYMKEFGDEIADIFTLKVDSITLKKKISFCLKKEYKDEPIYRDELDNFVDGEICDYRQKLQDLLETKEWAKNNDGVPISYKEVSNVKKIYYKIVHLIHPDLHPEFADDEIVQELWQKAVDFYKNNNFEQIERTYDEIVIYLKDHFMEEYENIDNIDAKIMALQEENKDIKENNPYLYKFILDDEEEMATLHEQLQKELQDYQEYIVSLHNELDKFPIIERGNA